MKTEYRKEPSKVLQRDMEYKIYGQAGKPIIVFAPQNGHFYDYENFHMVDALEPFIDSEQIQLFCVDSIDAESWSAMDQDNRIRSQQIEKFYHYICDELYPRIQEYNRIANNADKPQKLMTTGCSMGATHAANMFFRRPDLFDSVIALSGVFNAQFFFHDYMDDLVYANSIETYLTNMPLDHPYIELYRHSKMVFCVGKGKWEEAMIHSMDRLAAILRSKGVDNAWFDYWGEDVDHDWPWWQKQITYFMGKILEDSQP